MGFSEHLRTVDAATNKALEAIIGPMDECSSKKAQLPIRLGGLGIFSLRLSTPPLHALILAAWRV
jgi:hypothetical protein